MRIAVLTIIGTLGLGGLAEQVLADDMAVKMDDGGSVVLKEDGSWTYEGKGYAEPPDEEFVLGLDDGRDILIKPDWTWDFVKKGQAAAKPAISLKSAHSRNTAENIDVLVATAEARKQALANVSQKIKAASRKKVTLGNVSRCIEGLGMKPDTEEQFAKGKGWTVAVGISLNEAQILTVVECALGQDSTAATTSGAR